MLSFGIELGPDLLERLGFAVVEVRSSLVDAFKLGNVKFRYRVVPRCCADVHLYP